MKDLFEDLKKFTSEWIELAIKGMTDPLKGTGQKPEISDRFLGIFCGIGMLTLVPILALGLFLMGIPFFIYCLFVKSLVDD